MTWASQVFEAGVLDGAVWTRDTRSGGSIDVVEGRAFEGSHAVRLHLPSGAGARAAILNDALFPLPENHVFGRLFLLVTAAVPDTHSTVIRARGQLAGASTEYRLDSNGRRLNSRYTHPDVPEHGGWRKMGRYATADVWTCIEWEYDGTRGEMRYWIDGEAIDEMTVTAAEDPPWSAPIFDSRSLGWHTYQAAPDVEVLLDAVAIGTERVGCGS